MKTDQEYQVLVNEVQQLKKLCNNEKLAHQSSIDQLEVSYNLNQELQNVIKAQGTTINSLNKQLAQKSNRLSQIANSYENQILELKQFVLAKDRQLHSMRGTLSVTNYDMIRLRIINQLQIEHREKLQALSSELEKINHQYIKQNESKNILVQKLQHLKQQMQRVISNNCREMEQKQKKHMKQTNKIHQKFQHERLAKKQVEKALQSLNKKYQSLKQKYQQQINKAYQFSNASLNIKSKPTQSGQTKPHFKFKQSLQEKDRQIQSLRRKIQKQADRNAKIVDDLQQKLKQCQRNSMSYEQHMQKMREKQKQYEQQILSYDKKIRNLKQDHHDQVRKINKECDQKIEEYRQKMKIQKQNYSKNSINVDTPFKNFQDKQPLTERSQKQKSLEEKIKLLQLENGNLKAELSRKPIKNSKQGWNNSQIRSQSIQVYKAKLNQANFQIVTLLKDKVTLKQQINSLKQ